MISKLIKKKFSFVYHHNNSFVEMILNMNQNNLNQEYLKKLSVPNFKNLMFDFSNLSNVKNIYKNDNELLNYINKNEFNIAGLKVTMNP